VSVVAETLAVAAGSLRREDFSSVAVDYGTRFLGASANICVQIEPPMWKCCTKFTPYATIGGSGVLTTPLTCRATRHSKASIPLHGRRYYKCTPRQHDFVAAAPSQIVSIRTAGIASFHR
jgi:hypothetical protein